MATFKEEILARLINGEEAQAIADSIADELNDAISEYSKKQEADRVQEEKIAAAQAALTAILDFLEAYYPDLYDPGLHAVNGKDLLEAIDYAMEETKAFSKRMANFDQLLKDLEDLNKPKEKPKMPTLKMPEDFTVTINSTDPISDFLAKFVDN